MQVIQITSLTGHSPYDITICDITNTYCYVVATGVVSVPTTVEIPTELSGTQELIVVITDSAGCETFSNYNCFTPTPTPTFTPTPSITPTNISCNCISIENPSGITLNFGYIRCDGTQFYGNIYSATTLYVCGKQPYGDSGLIINVSSQVCVGNVCYGPFPTPTPTPSNNPTNTPTPTPSITPTHTPTNTPTPTPINYVLFQVQSCCTKKIIKYVMLPSTFLPGTAIVNSFGECLEIIGQSPGKAWITDYWNHSTTYMDCELCIKTQTCDPPVPLPFISVWTTTFSNETIVLPYEPSGFYYGTIDWGDGTISNNNYISCSHTYVTSGTYTITITGTLIGWSFGGYSANALNLIEVLQWGCLQLGNSGFNFGGCQNLTLTNVSDVLNLSGTNTLYYLFGDCIGLTTINNVNLWDTSNVTNMINTFYNCVNFNDNINDWDVSNVTDFGGMFDTALVFNQPIGTWDTISAQDMSTMFLQCYNFDQDLSNWDVSNVTNMSSMFYLSSFNNNGSPSISGWTTSNVSEMSGMFQDTPFNQPIDNWDVSNVINMSSMFYNATQFDQPLNSWDVGNVTNMSYMFNQSTSFNQPLNLWDVSNVTNMSGMFRDASLFNQDIGSWDVSNVTTMQLMFQGYSTSHHFNNGGSSSISGWTTSSLTNMYGMFNGNNSFNQNIGNWDVSNVTNFGGSFLASVFNNGGSPSISGWTINTTSNVSMYWMFRLSPFNQPIGSWNVSKVTNMESMFHSTFSFNQNIGSWNVSGVTNFTNFMAAKTFSDYSTTNLNAIYNGWSSLPSLQPSININFNTIKYTAGGSAGKAILQGSPNFWTITDGGI